MKNEGEINKAIEELQLKILDSLNECQNGEEMTEQIKEVTNSVMVGYCELLHFISVPELDINGKVESNNIPPHRMDYLFKFDCSDCDKSDHIQVYSGGGHE